MFYVIPLYKSTLFSTYMYIKYKVEKVLDEIGTWYVLENNEYYNIYRYRKIWILIFI